MQYSFEPDTIQHSRQPKGGRDLATYEARLLFGREELRGLTVLDFGSGPEVKFARELEAAVGARVISLSPDYGTKSHAKRAAAAYGGWLVAGVGQALPLPDECMDRAFGLNVCEHLGQAAFGVCVKELARVLRPGGAARLGPVVDIPYEWDWLWATQAVDYGTMPVQVTRLEIPKEVLPPISVQDSWGHRFPESFYTLDVSKPAGA